MKKILIYELMNVRVNDWIHKLHKNMIYDSSKDISLLLRPSDNVKREVTIGQTSIL